MKYYDKDQAYKRAKKEMNHIKSFYIHITVYLILNIYISIKTFIDHGIEAVGYSLMGLGFFWGLGVIFHWYKVFGKNLFFSKSWEEKKIKEILDNEL